jgi:ribosome-binding protein aMBF1 (putative translation factor)
LRYDPITGKVEKTAADRARHEAVRQRFADKPTREQLRACGELIPVGSIDDYLTLRRAQRILQEARLAAGLSIEEMALKTGLEPTVVEAIESGPVAELSLALVNRFAAAVGRRVDLSIATLQTQP